MEKFCVKKSERYWAQDKQLVLPIFELMYVWNLFKVVGKKWELCEAAVSYTHLDVYKRQPLYSVPK